MHTLGAIVTWAFFGLIVGAVARLLVPGRQPMGMIMTILLGIAGSIVGGLVSWIFSGGPDDPYRAAGFVMSLVGAVLVVWIYSASASRRGNV